MQIKEYIDGIINGNIATLGKAITLIESSLEKDQRKAEKLVERCIPLAGKSIRVAISGTPGVGKSTFIENLGIRLIQKNIKIAIIAIDPSSSLSKGSILGDKTRMNKLANSDLAFIRPSPNYGVLGGVTNYTKDIITIFEAAKFDIIIIETVGVGQSELIAESMTDCFIYLTLSQNGDELQFLKKGILELSDIIIINKADENKAKAKATEYILKQSIKHSPNKKERHVFICSALTGFNIDTIWAHLLLSHNQKIKNGEIEKKRIQQNTFWFQKILEDELKHLISKDIKFKKLINSLKKLNDKHPRKMALEIMTKLLK